jgi:UDP-3-O-[3-hydroxymyristoyl] glucosamine N-acyltransferase
MPITLGQIARLVDGQLHGDANLPITGADILRDARAGEITFAENARLADQLAASQAAAVLTPPEFEPTGIPYITVANVQGAFSRIVAHFRPPLVDRHSGVSPAAVVSPTARLEPNVTVHPLAFIGDDVTIGPRTVIHAGARLMAGCRLGADVVVFPNAVLYEKTVVGDRVLIHAGAVIGAYGFGYSLVDGRHQLGAQLGHVELGDDVEIGACSTVDRGTYGATVVGAGTKVDNLVTIAHNCRIGRHNVLCAQVGIAGSVTTGDYVMMAGQVGIRDHLDIGERAVLGAKAGVMQDVPPGESYVGSPATPLQQQKVIQVAILRLPELKKQLRDLAHTVARLEQSLAPTPPAENA